MIFIGRDSGERGTVRNKNNARYNLCCLVALYVGGFTYIINIFKYNLLEHSHLYTEIGNIED